MSGSTSRYSKLETEEVSEGEARFNPSNESIYSQSWLTVVMTISKVLVLIALFISVIVLFLNYKEMEKNQNSADFNWHMELKENREEIERLQNMLLQVQNESSNQIDSLRRDIQDLKQQAAMNSSYLHTQGREVNENLLLVSEEIHSLSLSRDDFAYRLNWTNSRVRQTDENIVHLSLSRDEHEHRLNWTDSRVRQTEKNLVEISDEVRNLSLSHNKHMHSLNYIDSQLILINAHLSSVKSMQSFLGNEILSIRANSMSLETAQNLTSDHLSNVTKILHKLEEQTQKKILSLSSHVDEIDGQLMNFSTQIQLITLSHEDHMHQLGKVNENIISISNKLVHIDDHLASLDSTQRSHSRGIASLQTERAALQRKITDVKNAGSLYEQEISRVKNDDISIQNDISQARENRRSMRERLASLEKYHSNSPSSSYMLCIPLILFPLHL